MLIVNIQFAGLLLLSNYLNMNKKQLGVVYYSLEFILFFIGIPLFLLFEADLIHPSSVLVPFLILVFLILAFTRSFKWRELYDFPIRLTDFITHLVIAFGISMLMLGWVYFFDNNNLFNLPRGNLKVWLMLTTFYPVFSAYAQEVIFRTFLFKRYEQILGKGWLIIFASAGVFSFAHIFYYHPVSMVLTFVLGLYLAWLYQKTRSVLFVAFLHGLYGNMVFTIGLGHYFWIDMFKWL